MMKQLKDIDLPLSPEEQARLNAAAKAWLDRRDPVAQELVGAIDEATEVLKAQREKNRQRIAEHNAELVRREWLAHGLEPQPYSFALAERLGTLPDDGEHDYGEPEA